MAGWLALEVLLNDLTALEDPVLEGCLHLLQNKIEERLRVAACCLASGPNGTG
jgi:hypothetical protein